MRVIVSIIGLSVRFCLSHLRVSLGITVLTLCGCALTPSTDATAAAAPPQKVLEPDAPVVLAPEEQAQYHVMAGELAAGRQQPKLAAEEFLKALDFSPDSKLAARATALALAANDDALAMQGAKKWLSIDSTSLDAREVITRLALRDGMDDEAYDQCAAIVRDLPGGTDDGFRHVALLLAQEPEKAAAATGVMDRLVKDYPKLPGAYQAQGLLDLHFNRPEQAEIAAREALKLKPQSRDASLLLVGALVKKGDLSGADEVMDSVTRSNPNGLEARLGYARLLIEAEQRGHAREQLDRVLKADPGNAEAHYSLGLLSLDEHKIDEAEGHFQQLVKDPEHATDAEYFLGRICEMRHQPQQALEHYEKVTSGNQALDASVRRAAMLGKLGKIADARTTLEELRDQYPPLAGRFTLAEGEILLEAGAYDDALAVYGDALKQEPDNLELLYSRSLVFEKLNRIAEAEADLRTILQKAPDDARALNALGYTLAVHTDRLDEADKLVSKAISLTPDDPAVIDSMGWLRFREGRSDEALPLLQKAYTQFPDPEVAAHLSEVLWTLGNRDKARALWAQASKADPENPTLRDTIKRLGP